MVKKIALYYIAFASTTGFIGGTCESAKMMMSPNNPNLSSVQNMIAKPITMFNGYFVGFARWGIFLPYSFYKEIDSIRKFPNLGNIL